MARCFKLKLSPPHPRPPFAAKFRLKGAPCLQLLPYFTLRVHTFSGRLWFWLSGCPVFNKGLQIRGMSEDLGECLREEKMYPSEVMCRKTDHIFCNAWALSSSMSLMQEGLSQGFSLPFLDSAMALASQQSSQFSPHSQDGQNFLCSN